MISKARESCGASGKTPAAKPISRAILGLAIFALVYAFGASMPSSLAVPCALGGWIVFEALLVVRKFRELKKLQAVCEIVRFLALFSLFYNWRKISFQRHPTLLIATVLYKPYYTLYGNARLALVMGFLILAVVLPVTLGFVIDPAAVDPLIAAYLVCVLILLAFCSELGAWVFGFESDDEAK